MKAKYRKVLELPTEIKRQIAREIGVCLRTVNRSLEITNPLLTETADRIRVRAREMGAVEIKKIVFE